MIKLYLAIVEDVEDLDSFALIIPIAQVAYIDSLDRVIQSDPISSLVKQGRKSLLFVHQLERMCGLRCRRAFYLQAVNNLVWQFLMKIDVGLITEDTQAIKP